MSRVKPENGTVDTGHMTRGPAPVWRYIVVLVNGVVRSTWSARSKEGADSFLCGLASFFASAERSERAEFRTYRTLRAYRAACAAFKWRDAR